MGMGVGRGMAGCMATAVVILIAQVGGGWDCPGSGAKIRVLQPRNDGTGSGQGRRGARVARWMGSRKSGQSHEGGGECWMRMYYCVYGRVRG